MCVQVPCVYIPHTASSVTARNSSCSCLLSTAVIAFARVQPLAAAIVLTAAAAAFSRNLSFHSALSVSRSQDAAAAVIIAIFVKIAPCTKNSRINARLFTMVKWFILNLQNNGTVYCT